MKELDQDYIKDIKNKLRIVETDIFKNILHDVLTNTYLTEKIIRDTESKTFKEQAFNIMWFALEMCEEIEDTKEFWKDIVTKEKNIDTGGLNEA